MALLPLIAAAAVASFLLSFTSALCPGHTHEVVFSWASGTSSAIDYVWPNETFRRAYEGINAVPIGIKVYDGNVYLTVPRWRRDGFPVNLARTTRPDSDCIRAFPTWEMNKLGDCSAFQFVQSFEIDPTTGVMWLPDMGREFGRSSRCSPKFVLMEISTGRILRVHHFPSGVASRTASFLNDIVLDITDPARKFAYISDSDEAAIVVYDHSRDKSWKVQHAAMRANPRSTSFDFLNPPDHQTIADNNVNGIAFSPQTGTVFFSPLTSHSTFAVSSAALRREDVADRPRRLDHHIRELTNDKPSQTDGLTVDKRGFLYMTEVVLNTVSAWDPLAQDFLGSRRTLAQDNATMIWPDTVSIDEQGYLWFTTRGWPIDKDRNYVVRVHVGAVSYLHYQN